MYQKRTSEPCMPVRSALGVIARWRDERTLVVTHQGSSRVWPLIASHALDFHYNQSTMGGAIPLALGVALAKPKLHVVVISGDGALTMSLGALISVVATGAQNVSVVVMDNGLYEVTGGQKIAAAATEIDYAALARSLGFPSAASFDDQPSWEAEAEQVLAMPGPRFIALRVDSAITQDMATALPPISARLSELAQRLATVD